MQQLYRHQALLNRVGLVERLQKFDHGLGISEDAAQVYAWLQWAKLHGRHDEVEDELNEWEGYVTAITRAEDIKRGKQFLEEMRGRADDVI